MSELNDRDSIRSSTYRTCEFGAETFTTDLDVTYAARDQYADSDRARRAFLSAKMILKDQLALHTSIPDLKAALCQTHFRTTTIKGTSRAYDTSMLEFDCKWLESSAELLAEHWCNLHYHLTNNSTKCNKYAIMMWLSTMAFSDTADLISVQVLAIFFGMGHLAAIRIPDAPSFSLRDGHTWDGDKIRQVITLHSKGLEQSPESQLPVEASDSKSQHLEKINSIFKQKFHIAMTKFLDSLKRKWPTNRPAKPSSSEISSYFNMQEAMNAVTEKYSAWNSNRLFLSYLGKVSKLIASQKVESILAPCYLTAVPAQSQLLDKAARYYGRQSIFQATAPVIPQDPLNLDNVSQLPFRPSQPAILTTEQRSEAGNRRMKDGFKCLCRLLDMLAKSVCEKQYVKALRESYTSLQSHLASKTSRTVDVNQNIEAILQSHLDECRTYLTAINNELKVCAIGQIGSSSEIASYVQQSPRIHSSGLWLSSLNRKHFDELSDQWKTVILELGLAITWVHRAQRLLALFDKPTELIEELLQENHTNWSVQEWPETLLLEVESGIMVRKIQEDIAHQMRNPVSGNTVLQLNMGEGKSSTILPIVAAALSNEKW